MRCRDGPKSAYATMAAMPDQEPSHGGHLHELGEGQPLRNQHRADRKPCGDITRHEPELIPPQPPRSGHEPLPRAHRERLGTLSSARKAVMGPNKEVSAGKRRGIAARSSFPWAFMPQRSLA